MTASKDNMISKFTIVIEIIDVFWSSGRNIRLVGERV